MFINETLLSSTKAAHHKTKSQDRKIERKLKSLGNSDVSFKNSENANNFCIRDSRAKGQSKKKNNVFEIDHWLKKYEIQSEGAHPSNPRDYNQENFLKMLGAQVDELLQKWTEAAEYFEQKNQQERSDKSIEEQAFQQCKKLLEEQFDNGESAHNATMNLTIKRMLQIDDTKLRYKNQISTTKKQIKIVAKQCNEIDKQVKRYTQTRQTRKNLTQQIQNTITTIQKNKETIIEIQARSFQQKDQFIEIQAMEFKLEREIDQIIQEQRLYFNRQFLNKKKKELQMLKTKVRNSLGQIESEVRPHLERKIDSMAYLRTQINQLSQQLDHTLQNIEQQKFIIDGLKQKCGGIINQSNHHNGTVPIEEYRKRYSQIYFGKNNQETPKWNQYMSYINELVAHQKSANSRYRTELDGIGNNYDQLQSKSNRTQQRFSADRKKSKSLSKKEHTKLPKLISVELSDQQSHNQRKIKQKIRNKALKKNRNRKISQFELESVNNSETSGSIIEVEFHKKNNS